ncbi:hypothetical protein EA004_19435 [Vibrio anguillarum]|uniref:Uncharacterized protein n=2 Tax=Vibrio anguillarum TaxID=55601 RepID=A0ABR9Z925_VIBAN|nr:hypothetical protein [Vibrio anguillarum]MBF4247152.1 hypothetical protein [Vibrio anguillarum]MBF4374921.1 hypothetical protein [Vibrio anguillarum]HCM0916353.1 hypothetical protein [Vibrio parahaemolyticus]
MSRRKRNRLSFSIKPNASSQSNHPKHCTSEQESCTKYNVVYEKLVKNNKDIVGLLAYCLYKQSKQQFIREFEKQNKRRPTDPELANHVNCSEIPKLPMYHEEATRSVALLLSQAAAEKEEELEKHFKERLWLFINKHEPEGFFERQWHNLKGLLYGGVGGVFGNFFTTALLVLFLFWAASTETRDGFFSSAKENLVSGLAQVIGVQVTITTDTDTGN